MSIRSTMSRLEALRTWRNPWRNGAALLLTATLLAGFSTRADAQFFQFWGGPTYGPDYQRPARLPPSAIFDILSRQGYRFVTPIERNGHVYLAGVIDPDGQRERVVIDASNGEVLQNFAAIPPSPRGYIPDPSDAGAPPRDGAYPPYPQVGSDESDGQFGEPRVIPGIGPRDGAPQADVPRTKAKEQVTHVAPAKVLPRPKKLPSVTARTTPGGGTAITPAASAAAPTVAASPAPSPAPKAETPPVTPTESAQAVEPPAPAAAKAAPAPARKATTPPAAAKQDLPGYADGVPVNPLD